MRIRLFMVCLLTCFLYLNLPAMARGENWVRYYEYSDGTVLSYDKDSIANRTRYIKQVWLKRDLSSIARGRLLERMQDQGFATEGYDKLSYHVVLFVIDCREKKSKPLSTMDYDLDGKVLFSNNSIDQQNWDDISDSDPMMSGLVEAICKPPSGK